MAKPGKSLQLAADLRAFALSLPETAEEFPWGESAFKVKGKSFVFMRVTADGFSFSCKLPLSRDFALSFPWTEPTGYGLGKSGWVTSTVAGEKVPADVLRAWIVESYRAVAPKKLSAQLDR